MPRRPHLYIIAGPNGAGKTTFAREFLPHLFRLYRALLDSWTIFDNSSESPRLIVRQRSGKLEIPDPALYAAIKQQAGEV